MITIAEQDEYTSDCMKLSPPPVCSGCGEGEKKAEPLELDQILRQLGRLPLYEDP
jgi:hypothetical protein